MFKSSFYKAIVVPLLLQKEILEWVKENNGKLFAKDKNISLQPSEKCFYKDSTPEEKDELFVTAMRRLKHRNLIGITLGVNDISFVLTKTGKQFLKDLTERDLIENVGLRITFSDDSYIIIPRATEKDLERSTELYGDTFKHQFFQF